MEGGRLKKMRETHLYTLRVKLTLNDFANPPTLGETFHSMKRLFFYIRDDCQSFPARFPHAGECWMSAGAYSFPYRTRRKIHIQIKIFNITDHHDFLYGNWLEYAVLQRWCARTWLSPTSHPPPHTPKPIQNANPSISHKGMSMDA